MYLVSDIDITYTPKLKISQLPRVTDSREAYKLLYSRWDKGKLQFIEQFKILMLNRNNRVLGIYAVSNGGISGTVVDAKVIFIAALKSCATSLILVHNHPSGNIKPSKDDLTVTRKLQEAGRLLDITVVDHLIITSEGYTSLSDDGYL